MNRMDHAPNYSTPIASTRYVRERLALAMLLPLRSRASVPDWNEIERALRKQLDDLARVIEHQRPGTLSRPGSNQSQSVLLYAYRVFESASNPEAEPIVVGVACKRQLEDILVRGDFCEEDSGVVRYEAPECRVIVPEGHGAVLGAASAVVAHLARETSRLIALLDGSVID